MSCTEIPKLNYLRLGAIEYILFKMIDVIKRKIIMFAIWLSMWIIKYVLVATDINVKYLISDPNRVIHKETQF